MDKTIFHRFEVWFVTGSQNLYGEDTLRQVADDARKIVKGLNALNMLAVELVWKETVKSAEEICALIREANAAERCIGLVTWMHTFSPAKMWITGLQELEKPFCQFHTQYNRDIPWSLIDMDFMNLNQSAHGGREFGFIGSRLRLERKVVVGHWEDDESCRRIDAWIRAAAAFADGKTLNVARFGDNMREVAVTEGDKVEAQKVFGYGVHGYGLGDLVAVLNEVADSDVDALVKEYNAIYLVSHRLEGGVGRERIRTAAKLEIAIRRFLENVGARAFTTTFENLTGLDQLPGVASQRLMAEGYGFGAEGDWKTSALVRAMKVMAAGRQGGTTFMEDYTYHFDPKRPLVLGAHMLEICPSIAAGPVRLDAWPLGIGGKDDPARLIFDAPGGPGLNVAVMDMGNRFRMVLNEVEAVDPPEQLPNLPVARVVWEPKPNLADAAAAWILAGGAHHSVHSRAITAEPITDYASMAGVELLRIDANSSLRELRNEIRWNQIYYHLAKGV